MIFPGSKLCGVKNSNLRQNALIRHQNSAYMNQIEKETHSL